jgi:dienelactone hydrolase
MKEDIEVIRPQAISFEHAGERLEGTLSMPTIGKPPYPAVIFFHGMTSSQDKYIPMAQALAAQGVAGMTVNIRGHGKSGGTLDDLTAAELETDGLATYDFLAKQKGIDLQRIGICGGSFGALLAATASASRDVKSMLLRVPAAYTEAMRRTRIQEIMANQEGVFFDIKDARSTPAVNALRDFKGKLLVVASEKDNIIPAAIPQAFYDAAQHATHREFEVMHGAPHAFSGKEMLDQFTARQLKWFVETL